VPLGPQPRRARGTVERPYSALNLRRVIAAIGVVAFAVLGGLAFGYRHPWWGAVAFLFAVAGLVDLAVIGIRIGRRKRLEPRDHSLFE
jgi:hypothetical protein